MSKLFGILTIIGFSILFAVFIVAGFFNESIFNFEIEKIASFVAVNLAAFWALN